MTIITATPEALKKAAAKKARAVMEQGRAKLIRDHRFWGVQAMALNLREAMEGELPENSPMGVDGISLIYAPDLIVKMPEKELEFVWAHEVMHCALNHVTRLRGREPFKWNVACDLAVNGTLKDAGFDMPAEALYHEKFKGTEGWFGAETIYDMLPDMPQPQKLGVGVGKSGMEKTGNIQEPPSEGQGGQKKEEIEANWKRIVAEAANMARQAGKGTGAMEHLVDSILGTQVDWRDVLADFIQKSDDDYTWQKPIRRFMVNPGVLLPGIDGEDVKDIVLSIDTSGSVGDKELSALLGEMRSILQMFPSIRLKTYFHCDDIYREEVYSGDNPPPIPMTNIARGGTDFRPTFARIDQDEINPQCVIMLTDCEGPTPHDPPPYPVLWLSVGSETVPWGTVIKLRV